MFEKKSPQPGTADRGPAAGEPFHPVDRQEPSLLPGPREKGRFVYWLQVRFNENRVVALQHCRGGGKAKRQGWCRGPKGAWPARGGRCLLTVASGPRRRFASTIGRKQSFTRLMAWRHPRHGEFCFRRWGRFPPVALLQPAALPKGRLARKEGKRPTAGHPGSGEEAGSGGGSASPTSVRGRRRASPPRSRQVVGGRQPTCGGADLARAGLGRGARIGAGLKPLGKNQVARPSRTILGRLGGRVCVDRLRL